MNVIVMVSNSNAVHAVTFCLESEFGAHVFIAEDSFSAIDRLLEETPVDYVVCDQDADTAKLFKYLLSTNAEIPVVITKLSGKDRISTFPELNVIAEIEYSKIATSLGAEIKKHMGKKGAAPDTKERMVRIKTELLLGVGPLGGDVYVRLSSVKHVRLFKEGYTFNKDDLKRYLEGRKIDYLYVKSRDALEFAVKLASLVSEKVATAGAPQTRENSRENLEVLSHLFEQIQTLSSVLGFSTEVNQIAKETVNLTLKTIGNDPKLSDFLKNFDEYKTSYISSHSLMVANLSVCIAAMMKWPSAGTFQKLVYAALFHDLCLENEDLAKVETLEELKNSTAFTVDETLEYPAHPHKSALLLLQFKELPPDIDSIIIQHHERPDGSGFPAGLNAMTIAPISAAFILAHDVVNEMVKSGSSVNVSTFLQDNFEFYARGNFKEIFKRLREHQSFIPTEETKAPVAS